MKETKLAICEVCGIEAECRLVKSEDVEFYMCHSCIVQQVKEAASIEREDGEIEEREEDRRC